MKDKVIGIYKITNPKGKIYIGQSVNINKRFLYYKGLQCKGQKKVYSSLFKYGFENHKFEIITQGLYNKELLNDLEKHYIQLYNSYRNGLNLSIGGGTLGSGKDHPCYGRKLTKEHREKISIKSRNISEETREKIRISSTGRKHTEETKLKLKEKHLNKVMSLESREKMRKNLLNTKRHSKKVIDTSTGIEYDCAKDLSVISGIKYHTLIKMLKHNNSNYHYK